MPILRRLAALVVAAGSLVPLAATALMAGAARICRTSAAPIKKQHEHFAG